MWVGREKGKGRVCGQAACAGRVCAGRGRCEDREGMCGEGAGCVDRGVQAREVDEPQVMCGRGRCESKGVCAGGGGSVRGQGGCVRARGCVWAAGEGV